MTISKFKLKGLTCEACVKLSTTRFKRIAGVQDVKINLLAGDVRIIPVVDDNEKTQKRQ